MPSERAGKQAGLALLGCMAAVAVILWGWPTSPLRSHHGTRSDVALPAAQGNPLPVPVLTSPARDSRPTTADERQASDGSRADARPSANVASAQVRPASAVEPADLALIGERVAREAIVPIASHAIALPMRPVVPERPRMLTVQADDSLGHAFAHAGISLGSAFRRAGVNTGAAFSRIFD